MGFADWVRCYEVHGGYLITKDGLHRHVVVKIQAGDDNKARHAERIKTNSRQDTSPGLQAHINFLSSATEPFFPNPTSFAPRKLCR